MKKWIALLLAAVMLLSLTACGGSAEPVETTPATTEAAPQVTEELTEAPTEPRVAPVDFEAVDPATLPEPIPVEEQLLSEDTQTVTLDSLEEYEDLLWSLGFEEVRLAGTHQITSSKTGSCEPVSLTYNNQAFRLNFTYCLVVPDETTKEDGWYMYGTKSSVAANVSPLSGAEYFEDAGSTKYNVIDHTKLGLGLDENATDKEIAAAIVEMLRSSTNILQALAELDANTTEVDSVIVTPDYEEKTNSFGLKTNNSAVFYLKTVYYPVTGNVYNYMRDDQYKEESFSFTFDQNGQEHDNGYNVGGSVREMCFHYLFPAEDAAE